MNVTLVPMIKSEIAVAWIQVGNAAVRVSVRDRRLHGEGYESITAFRYHGVVMNYRSLAPMKCVHPRAAWFDSHTAAMNWFNRTERRHARRIGKLAA